MFKDKAEMQEHEKTVHGGIKYPCPEIDCPFTTSDVKELEEHVEIHQGMFLIFLMLPFLNNCFCFLYQINFNLI
jgi:hypothetical protein